MAQHDRLGPPYGPPANLVTILAAWRERGTPAVVDRPWFERIGLSGNLATRNLHALRFLRLIDDDHRPTELAERLRTASNEAYPSTLAAIVRTAYARVWAFCDPTTASRTGIEDAFRHEMPAAQRRRMVTCFRGLCAAAGIALADTGAARPPVQPRPALRRGRDERRPALEPIAPLPRAAPVEAARPDDVAAWLAKFPAFDPAWSDGVKEKWIDAFVRLRDELRRP